MEMTVGQQVVFLNRVHRVISIFPKSSRFFGSVLLSWVDKPIAITEFEKYSKKKHKHLPTANEIIRLVKAQGTSQSNTTESIKV
jgi:hypothetical protein